MRDVHNPPRAKIARLAALFAVLALSGCGGFFRDDDNTPAPAELEDFEPSVEIDRLWSRQAASGAGPSLELRPAVAGGRVFTAGRDGDVAAYDAGTGERLWETDVETPVSGGTGAGPGVVVVGSSDGDVVALDGAGGEVAWRARVSSEVLSAPAVSERVVVVRTIDGKLFGLDAANGERLWVYDRAVPALTLRGTSSPVIAQDTVVAGFDSGRLVAVSLDRGQLLWESQVATQAGRTELERLADIDADPIVVDGVVYAIAFQGRLAAFDLRTGRLLWQRDMSSHAGVGAGRRLLYVTDDESHVWALDRDTGASLWRQGKLERRRVTRPVEFAGYVVVADFEGHVHWLNIEDGSFAARVRAGGGVTAFPVATEAAVYVFDTSGELTALAPP